MEWFRFGLVGFSYKSAYLTTYVFNPDEDQPTVVVAAGVDFKVKIHISNCHAMGSKQALPLYG